MKEIFGRFFAILLVGLLLIKVSSFHVYEHYDVSDDSNTTCELCVLAIEGQQTEGIFSSLVVIEYAPLPTSFEAAISFFEGICTNPFDEGNLFCRPPPVLLA